MECTGILKSVALRDDGATITLYHRPVGHAAVPDTTHEVAPNVTVTLDGAQVPITDLREGHSVGLSGSPVCVIAATRAVPVPASPK